MRLKAFLRRAVWTVTGLATFLALFYAEEDWRGARNLHRAADSYARTGASLDQTQFVPPLVPDAENLALLPLFMQSWAKSIRPAIDQPTGPYLHPVALERRCEKTKATPIYPRSEIISPASQPISSR